jgi:hypothetical protein
MILRRRESDDFLADEILNLTDNFYNSPKTNNSFQPVDKSRFPCMGTRGPTAQQLSIKAAEGCQEPAIKRRGGE